MGEGLQYGLDVFLVKREPLPAPIVAGAELAQLAVDGVAVFFLPLPNPVDHGGPSQVVAALALDLQKFLLNLYMGGNARVISARQAERLKALHPLPPDD